MMARVTKQSKKKYSYADYLQWQDDKRREIIEGVVYDMNAPLRIHQKISMALCAQLYSYFKNSACEVYAAPFDVRLTDKSEKDQDIFDVVQPDISVICDKKKLDEKGCVGPPEMLIEIMSPSTASIDNIKKRELYEKHGVKEYWILDPANRMMIVYRTGEDQLYQKPVWYNDKAVVSTQLFPDLQIKLEEVFPELPSAACDNPPPGYRK
jgi:Uma2 family endonuclease